MTNKYILATVMLLAAGYVNAQNKLSPSAISILEEYKEKPLSRSAAPEVCAIVTLNTPDDIDRFEALGLEIMDVRNGIVLVQIPMDRVEEVAALDCVRDIQFGQQAYPMMDKARESGGVDKVHSGQNLPKAYTGAGVVTGLFDTGLDYDHINFTDDNGETRIIAASKITNGNPGKGVFTTDNKDETHGTHVLGIMAGSYKGEGEYSGTTGNIPYYGIATGSDIVMTGSDNLIDANILGGVKYCIDNAKELGKPVVVNISIGTNVGTHDGTSSFNRMLDSYGEEAIIVMSAGNEGETKMGVGKVFTATDNKLTTSIYPIDATTGSKINNVKSWAGNVAFYASDERPFKFSIAVVGLDQPQNPEIISEYVIDSSTEGKSTCVGGRPNNLTTYQPLEEFDYAVTNGTNSYFKVMTNVNTANNCYYASADFNLSLERENSPTVLAFIIEGQEGQRVRGYVNSTGTSRDTYTAQFSNRGVTAWADGECNGTINDMACGKNLMAIGSYNSRNRWPTITSSIGASLAYTVNDISPFSSYGTLADGRNLPHICAPGAVLVSSYSHYYVEAKNASNSDLSAKVLDDYGIENYWGRMQGTSMSSPFAAGVFALWLEANPNLDVNAIRDIATKTAVRDRFVEQGDPVQWGAGKLDAYEGLKMALNYTSSVTDVLADKAIMYSEVAPGVYDIFAQGACNLSAAIYSLNGNKAAAVSTTGESATLSAEGLNPGIYILRLDADGKTETHKIVVR